MSPSKTTVSWLIISLFILGIIISILELVSVLKTRQCEPSINRVYSSPVVAYNHTLTEPSICIIIRTYVGHNPDDRNRKRTHRSITDLFDAFQNFTNSNWTALIINTDTTPFPELEEIVSNTNDNRFKILNISATSSYQLGDAGYYLTDNAIPYCPQHTDWLLITNGDNHYKKEYVSFC